MRRVCTENMHQIIPPREYTQHTSVIHEGAAAVCGKRPRDTESHVQQPRGSMAPLTQRNLRRVRSMHCSCFLTVFLGFLLDSSAGCTSSSSRTSRSSHQHTTKGSWFNSKATTTRTDKRTHAPLRWPAALLSDQAVAVCWHWPCAIQEERCRGQPPTMLVGVIIVAVVVWRGAGI